MKEINTYFIDTNVFLRTLIKEDKNTFNDCLAFFEKVKNNKCKAVTASIVIAEVVWTLLSFYKVSKSEVIMAVNSIKNMRGLSIIDGYDIKTALQLFEDKNVKFIDCMIASTKSVSKDKITIVSFDKDFDKLGIARKEPKQIASVLSL